MGLAGKKTKTTRAGGGVRKDRDKAVAKLSLAELRKKKGTDQKKTQGRDPRIVRCGGRSTPEADKGQSILVRGWSRASRK